MFTCLHVVIGSSDHSDNVTSSTSEEHIVANPNTDATGPASVNITTPVNIAIDCTSYCSHHYDSNMSGSTSLIRDQSIMFYFHLFFFLAVLFF